MTEPSSDETKLKIVVDEDWKTRVEAEKEAFRQLPQNQAHADSDRASLPPASLAFLLTTLANQAMVCLGLVPNPLTNKTECRLNEAQHFIDTLQILYEKTQGNRTPEETALLEDLLHHLRLGYITAQELFEQGVPGPGQNPPDQV